MLELASPASDGFADRVDAALSQKFFDIAQAQREAAPEPDSEPDDVRGKGNDV